MLHVPPRDPHDQQFGTPALQDEPRLTFARVLTGVAVAAVVIGFGYLLRSDLLANTACDVGWQCPPPVGSSVPLLAWYSIGVIAGVVLVTWPWIRRAFGFGDRA
jgi:hypothetical protein